MMNTSTNFGNSFVQPGYNGPSRASNDQSGMFSPHLGGQAAPGGFYDSYQAKQFAQGQQPQSQEFTSSHQNTFYNHGDMKALNSQVPPWEQTQQGQNNPNQFIASSPFKPQRISPNNWQGQNQAQTQHWDNTATANHPAVRSSSRMSRPSSRSRSALNRTPIPLLDKVKVYESEGHKVEIRDVWQENLESEMAIIRGIIEKYNYVAMDTEFPGVVARPICSVHEKDYNYQMLRCNVDLLNLIQLGLSFADEDGNLVKRAHAFPDEKYPDNNSYVCCWQFHFQFSLQENMYAQDSIELLKRSGIDFDLHESHGISISDFGELLISSGLVLLKDVHWIAFHGSYDFAYLLKVLTCATMPKTEDDFLHLLGLFFPNVYDIKHMKDFSGGLNRLAESLETKRIGTEHQAGSDSLLTLQVFFQLKAKHLDAKDAGDFMEKCGMLHGIGAASPRIGSPRISGMNSPLVA